MPYVAPHEIERIKSIDLLTYLMSNEPDELVKRSSREYCTKTHDSLVISNGKWHWFSRGIGGKNALDYLVRVKEMSFLEAVLKLQQSSTVPLSPLPPLATRATPKKAHFSLPHREASNDKARSYLKLRGIDDFVISECIKRGLIYESNKGNNTNVVFVGRDKTGKPRYAFLRGCVGDFKGEAAGSDKRYSFRLVSTNGNPALHVFESAIDALSYATLRLHSDIDWRRDNLLSLGGIQITSAEDGHQRIPQALAQWIEDESHTREIVLHLDSDSAGMRAADAIATALHKRFECSIVPPPIGKDMNDYLLGKSTPKRANEPVR